MKLPRDYSFHTEGMPIQLVMYLDRMEIINPGGLYCGPVIEDESAFTICGGIRRCAVSP